jgi:hypothetical protein
LSHTNWETLDVVLFTTITSLILSDHLTNSDFGRGVRNNDFAVLIMILSAHR